MMMSCFFDRVDHVGWNVSALNVLAEIVVIDVRALVDKIDNSLEVRLGANRQLNWSGLRFEPVDNHFDRALERRTSSVHLVDEAEPGNAVFVGLPPHGFGLRLNAGDGIEDDDATVEHAKRSLDLNREVNVSRRVDDIDR